MGGASYGTSGGFTPNITLDYLNDITGGEGSWFHFSSYGDLNDVAFINRGNTGGSPSNQRGKIVFTADPGFLATLNSFDMASFDLASVGEVNLRVRDGSGSVLFESLATSFNESHTNIMFSPPLSASVLQLELDVFGIANNIDSLGLDNIEFGQIIIPEPGSVIVLGLGMLGLGMRRRTAWRS